MKTNVKSRATYTTDLRDLKLVWDAARNTITIILPETRVDSIEDTEWDERVSYTRARIIFSACTRQALAKATRLEVKAQSRMEAGKHIARIRAECVKALQSVLEEKFQEIKPGIKVLVE
jgi:hypothetical protein